MIITQNLLLLLCSIIPLIFSTSFHDIYLNSDENCSNNTNEIQLEKYSASLIKFSTRVAYGQKNCSVNFLNPWLIETQNGIAISLPRSIDCGSKVTIQCLPDTLLPNQIHWNKSSPIVQFNCHQSDRQIILPCSAISVTYKRNIRMNVEKTTTHVQLVALAKGPCIDGVLFFSCSRDYPGSCIDARLRCNDRSECLNGDDEFNCHQQTSTGTPLIVIILGVLAFLSLLCIVPTILICCFCRAACNAIIRRFRTKESIQKGDVTITGEDAGLIKGLTGATAMTDVVPTTPASIEPTALMIDSTKPIYPRLE